MVKLSRIVKDYQDSGTVNSFVNLFGFIDDHVFLTKSGEVGVVLKVDGRDYECLDGVELNDITRRFEASVRSLRRCVPDLSIPRQARQRADPAKCRVRESGRERGGISRVEYLEGKGG